MTCSCGQAAFVTMCDAGWDKINGKWEALGKTYYLCRDCYYEKVGRTQ